MSRKRRKTSKDEVDTLYRRCQYCKAHRGARFFNRHEAACKARWIIRNETHQSKTTASVEKSSTTQLQYHLPVEGIMEGSSEMRLEDTINKESEADQLDVSESRDSTELVVEPILSK